MSRGNQSQHAPRAREDALADRSTLANLITDDVPTRPAGDPPIKHEGHPQRLPPHIETCKSCKSLVNPVYNWSKVSITTRTSLRSSNTASGSQASISSLE